ncbi:helix-turn-helix domain-containing protein [Streptacidiphilus fuscans]|uniref:Helix-turn-helix domain-containing protein n=1 Tax=Streptacidiphilus fuscans TaxID=2789292 RepID=A0A931B1T3_9ACTN|nr:helix-turn-helix domain-containing protein [Streptacidiphilus fuscans]MBF9066458.1 helix-turn-helix domain-containing protein [Streptacidiphilus fuscans]
MLPQPPGVDPRDCIYVGVYRHGTASYHRSGIEVLLEPGDLLIAAKPHVANVLRDRSGEITFFRIPCFYLGGVTWAEVRRAGGLMARGGEGIGSLLSQFLLTLAAQPRAQRAVTGSHLARSVADLAALLVMDLLEQENPTHPTAAAELLARIRSHIEENLMDPSLSPESIARAHFISVRYLHKLFKQEGVTVGHWVRRRRLEACRRELGRSFHRRSSVAAVAQRWGFVSASHFSRVFRDTFGVSPSEWQAHAETLDNPSVVQASGHPN